MGELLGAAVLVIGATITPCILPLYPGFLAYLTVGANESRRLPAAATAALVWAGVVVGMIVIGAVFAALAAPLGDFVRVVLPVADGLLIVLGVLLVFGRNPFARLPQLSPRIVGRGGPAAGAFAYGLLFAPIAVPCSGPLLVVIFAYSLTIGDLAAQLAFFLAFGIGFGLPLFSIGLLDQLTGARVARTMVRWERPVQLVLGPALVVVGAWDLAMNLPLLLT
ncbi:MAG: cytochrome c biogenesis protein CcdA [Chloroflexota bacterium]